MDNLKGNEIKAADLILREGLLESVVSLSSLYGRHLHIEYDFKVFETAARFLLKHEYITAEKVNYSNGCKLTDKGHEFAESGKSIREKITELEFESLRIHAEQLTQLENDRQDKDLVRKSSIAQIQSLNIAHWALILTVLGIVIAICISFKE